MDAHRPFSRSRDPDQDFFMAIRLSRALTMYRIEGTIPTKADQTILNGQLRCHSDHLIGGEAYGYNHKNHLYIR